MHAQFAIENEFYFVKFWSMLPKPLQIHFAGLLPDDQMEYDTIAHELIHILSETAYICFWQSTHRELRKKIALIVNQNDDTILNLIIQKYWPSAFLCFMRGLSREKKIMSRMKAITIAPKKMPLAFKMANFFYDAFGVSINKIEEYY